MSVICQNTMGGIWITWICSVLQAAGHFWGRLEEARPCRCRLRGACGRELHLTSSCMLLALCMSSLAQTGTTMSQLCGKTSWQVRIRIMLFFCVWFKRFFFLFTNYTHFFLFWKTTYITSGNSPPTTWTARTTTALSCIMDGELIFKET